MIEDDDEARNFADHPKSITEARASRSSDAADWTPRDALILLLREIDSGSAVVDSCVIAYRLVNEDGSKTAAYINASPDGDVALGVLTRVTATIASN